MIRTARPLAAALGAAAFGVWAACATAGSTASAGATTRVRVGQLPAGIISNDGSILIAAAPSTLAYRTPVLTFVENTRRDFLHAARLEMPPLSQPIVVVLGDSTNDTRVTGSRASNPAGGEYERIDLPDPEHGDLDAFRAAVVRALVREWMLAARPSDATAPSVRPPAWLLDGLARHIGRRQRQADIEAVHDQWACGRLPPPGDLLAGEPAGAMLHPALPAVVCAWLLDHPGDTLGTLLRRLAGGEVWTSGLVAACLRVRGDPAGLGEDWDAWQARAVCEVRQPGVTTPGVVRAFRAQVLIYPGDYGIAIPDAWRGRTFDECLSLPPSTALRAAVTDKAVRLQLFAAGRDGTLQRVAGAYALFLEAWARGEPRDELRALLTRANEAMGQLEARAAKGETLREPLVEPSGPDNRNPRRPHP